jgi:dihydrofolate synthase/folylpolyglutamate synthase
VAAPPDRHGGGFRRLGRARRHGLQDQERFLDLPAPALAGGHQIDNAGLAVAAALELDLPEAAIAEGLRTAVWPARMQRLTEGPYGERRAGR